MTTPHVPGDILLWHPDEPEPGQPPMVGVPGPAGSTLWQSEEHYGNEPGHGHVPPAPVLTEAEPAFVRAPVIEHFRRAGAMLGFWPAPEPEPAEPAEPEPEPPPRPVKIPAGPRGRPGYPDDWIRARMRGY
jgi:hypothetical protein